MSCLFTFVLRGTKPSIQVQQLLLQTILIARRCEIGQVSNAALITPRQDWKRADCMKTEEDESRVRTRRFPVGIRSHGSGVDDEEHTCDTSLGKFLSGLGPDLAQALS